MIDKCPRKLYINGDKPKEVIQMIKTKFKFLIVFLILALLSLNSFCFGADVRTGNSEQNKIETISYDLYIENKDNYSLKDIVNGNVFVTVDTLDIDPSSKGGIINGNVFAVANNVNIKSDISSDTEQSVNNTSTISGNLYVVANKFVLEPGCEIKGDLYVVANEIALEQNSKINGNVFAVASTLTMNAQVSYDLYASVENFDMQYYGFISRDLHLTAQTSNLNGYIYRNSFINSKSITLYDKFINEKDFNVEDANDLTFAGLIKGNANINSKKIAFNPNRRK